MNIRYINFDAHDYKHELCLYKERKWDAHYIEKIPDDKLYVDTIEDVLKDVWKRHLFDNEFEFSIFEINNNMLLRFVIFFLDKGYKLETTKDMTFYKFRK